MPFSRGQDMSSKNNRKKVKLPWTLWKSICISDAAHNPLRWTNRKRTYLLDPRGIYTGSPVQGRNRKVGSIYALPCHVHPKSAWKSANTRWKLLVPPPAAVCRDLGPSLAACFSTLSWMQFKCLFRLWEIKKSLTSQIAKKKNRKEKQENSNIETSLRHILFV